VDLYISSSSNHLYLTECVSNTREEKCLKTFFLKTFQQRFWKQDSNRAVSLSESGRLFHMAAAQMIEHPLYSLSAETETHLADHDEQSGNNQMTGWQRSDKHCDARPCWLLYTWTHNLYVTWSETSNQWMSLWQGLGGTPREGGGKASPEAENLFWHPLRGTKLDEAREAELFWVDRTCLLSNAVLCITQCCVAKISLLLICLSVCYWSVWLAVSVCLSVCLSVCYWSVWLAVSVCL